ncbi:MAG: RagB/SusD family nutrient uptake outer membrane protein, partial [Capnocytophaga sp.]|nr:RagB/SusD family nutrient uptake outer membrane protein [Capnocytophaga sp.]
MKKIVTTICIAALLAGCEIERFPYNAIEGSEVASDPGKLGAATLGNYALLKGDADGGGFMNQLHRLAEYPTDNVSLSGTTTDPLFYMYNYHNLVTGYRTNTFWVSGYRAIVGCNKIILAAAENQSDEMNQLLGENYYLRAFTYFQLSNIFGRPYLQGTGNLSVPIKLSADVDDLPDRNTVGEVYNQVVSDLLKAEALMSVNKSSSYATKEAAQALLSRVYLYMGENDKSIEYADKVINSGRYSLVSTSELAGYSTKNPDENTETIFCFKYLRESDYNHGWYTVGSMYATIQGVGWGEMYASHSLMELMREHPEDARFGWIEPQYLLTSGNRTPSVYYIDADYKYVFRPTTEESGNTYFDHNGTKTLVQEETAGSLTKYFFMDNGVKTYLIKDYDMVKRNGFPKFFILKCSNQSNVPQLWSPLVSRLAEMYLNRAEAYQKLGNDASALENINVIRKRAGIPEYGSVADLPAGTTLAQAVANERRMELAFEGHRKFDIFRNNQTLDRRYPGTHLNGNNPY